MSANNEGDKDIKGILGEYLDNHTVEELLAELDKRKVLMSVPDSTPAGDSNEGKAGEIATEDLINLHKVANSKVSQIIQGLFEAVLIKCIKSDAELTQLRNANKNLEAENERMREALKSAPVHHTHNCLVQERGGKITLARCHEECWEPIRNAALNPTAQDDKTKE